MKSEKYFLRQNFKKTKSLYYTDQYLAINFLGQIFEKKAQKQKQQMVSDKKWSRTKYFHLK